MGTFKGVFALLAQKRPSEAGTKLGKVYSLKFSFRKKRKTLTLVKDRKRWRASA